jgi:hypothetical protein
VQPPPASRIGPASAASQKRLVKSYEMFVSTHLGRAAIVLLCIITEVQAYARFEEHRINERIVKMWDVLLPVFEAKELYDGRYAKLMADRGIS